MAASCDHQGLLVMSAEWTMSESVSWWQTKHNAQHTELRPFEFAPNVQLSVVAHSFGEDWGFFQFCSSDPLAHHDFDVFLWIEQDGKELGNKNGVPLAVNEGIEAVHGYNPVTIIFEVQYKKSCPYCIIEADRGIKFVAAEEPVQQVDGKENVSSSLASTSANMTNENGGQSTSSSSYKTSTSLNNLPGSSRSCEQEPMDVNENERPQLSEEAMNQQEMFNKFQQAFDSLPAEHRAAIIGSFTVFKEASNLG